MADLRAMTDSSQPMKPLLVKLALTSGFKPEAVKKWRQYGRVPPKHHAYLLMKAQRRLVAIREEDLTFAATRGTGTARKAQARLG